MGREKPHTKGKLFHKGHNSPGQCGEKLSEAEEMALVEAGGQEARWGAGWLRIAQVRLKRSSELSQGQDLAE